MATTPRPGDTNYGTAPEGSLSEERAKKAALWVEKEVFKLLGEIEGLGRHNGNEVHVTFGELFVHYQDVSDTLVGIMARAKKRGLLKYEGQGGHMLFQGKHDSVLITLDKAKSAQWRKEYQSGAITSDQDTKSSGPKKALTVKEQYEEEKRRKSAGAVLTTTSTQSHTAPTPPPKPALTREASPPPAAPSPPAAVAAKPQPVETSSHSGFLASMMGKLLPSPQGSDAAPSPTPTPSVEVKQPEPVDNSSLTRSIMASVSRLLPSRESASDIGDDVLNAVRISAQKAKAQQQQLPPQPSKSPSPPPTPTPMSTPATPSPTTTVSKQPAEQSHHVVHAALPQRTRDGTRGAVLKTPPSTPPAPAPKSPARPVSVTKAQAPQAPASSATLKKDQEEWAKKHVSRGVVASTPATTTTTAPKQSAYAKLAAFQDPPAATPATPSNNSAVAAKLASFQDNKHRSMPASANVAKKTDVFEKAKQSSTLPTGLQKRFAWE